MTRTAAPSPLATLLARPSAKGPLCTVTVVARRLPDAERDLLAAAMSRLDLTGRDIADTLATMGFRVQNNTINRHRRKECACWTRADGWQHGDRSQ